MTSRCGLLSEKNEPVPLKRVEVEVRVQGHVATVNSTLQYENHEDRPLEAVFVFPLDEDASLCHFSIKIGERELLAELKEKEKAQEDYDDALSSGQQAFLLEESEQSSDVFQMRVGNLPPGESASVTLSYVTELPMQADDALRFCLPAVLNPRYAPADHGSVPQVTSVPAGAVPYTLSLSVHLSAPSPISRVQSNCPLQPLEYLDSAHKLAKVSLSPGHMFDRDVEVLIYYSNTHLPTTIVEAGKPETKAGSLMGDPVVMLSLYPEFPAAATTSLHPSGEFLFLVDQSGSMDCPMHNGPGSELRIESARNTLLLLLKSLPIGCYFNIYGFGSTFTSFFPESVKYSQETMDQALEKLQKISADLGGTEILQPLQHIYKQPCLPEHPRQLFLFTDGEVWNNKEILSLVKKNALAHRCFTFGIGEGASSALISGMAKEGSGHAQFITGTDRLQPKVMQSLRFALQPAAKQISVKWNVPAGMSVTQLSPPLSALFQGQRALLYAQLTGECKGDAEGSVCVTYTLGEELVKNQLSFSLKPEVDPGLTIHKLCARALIRSLDGEEEKERRRVVELSLASGVSSGFTAFIAVCREGGKTTQGPLLHREVPTPSLSGSCGTTRMMACSGPMMGHPLGLCGVSMQRNAQVACSFPGLAPPIFQSYSAPIPEQALMDCTVSESLCGGLESGDEIESEPKKDPLIQLISLQKASGCWDLAPELAEVLGKTEEEVTQQAPPQVDSSFWATVLALLWLYGFQLETQEEWQFVAMKAVSWIKGQKGAKMSQCVQAANALLDRTVQQATLGL